MTEKQRTLLGSIIWGIVAMLIALFLEHNSITAAIIWGVVFFILTYLWNRMKDKKRENDK
ncbi:hypothetical protein NW130_08640 [Staphylococcus pettenkoferi]|uniref:hypothetical protein n=1 Tax=Staphylococcus pettenkoferi TaxID=170573 RepID=UPI002272BE59|nr:hypothetical protein [Staphylococcus pettenkoferi]MCY1616141.1 hypothetical protein [Staphylococcus pettenkoferi]